MNIKFIEEIQEAKKAIKEMIRKKNLPPSSDEWIENKLKEYVSDWGISGSSVIYKDIVGDWEDYLKEKDNTNKHLESDFAGEKSRTSWAGGWKSIETLKQVEPIAEVFRQEVFEKLAVKLPFETIDEGITWLRKQQEEEQARYERFEYSTLTLTVGFPEGTTNNYLLLLKIDQIMKETKENLQLCLNCLKEEFPKGRLFALNQNKFTPKLIVYDSKGNKHKFYPHEGGILKKLYNTCEKICEETGWWTQRQALRFLLCGNFPYADIRYKVNLNPDVRITLEICGPATEEDVLAAYKKSLEDYGITVKKLSYVQFRLLYLVYKNPSASWPKRLKEWLEWRKLEAPDKAAEMPNANL